MAAMVVLRRPLCFFGFGDLADDEWRASVRAARKVEKRQHAAIDGKIDLGEMNECRRGEQERSSPAKLLRLAVAASGIVVMPRPGPRGIPRRGVELGHPLGGD